VAADAPPYSIVANGSPGVVVTVNPTPIAATATYTLTNIHATAALTGGTGTIELEAPAETVFPNIPGDFSITDSTTSSGSGTVTAALSGGSTNVVTFTVPNTINSGDVLTITVGDVRNPSTASSTDSITLKGNVTGPTPTPATTTTTTTTSTTTTVAPTTTRAPTTSTAAPTTTTTTIVKRAVPVIRELTSRIRLSKNAAHLKLRCTLAALCKGAVTLRDGKTVVASER
jgi:hypothetical protein